MKHHRLAVIAVFTALFLLASCENANSQAEMTSSTKSTPESNSIASSKASVSAKAVESTPSAPESEAIYPSELTYYERIEDIPNLNLRFSDDLNVIENDDGFGIAAPGPSDFVNPVFADSRYLYARAVWPSGVYQWFYFAWDMSNVNDILIPDSQEKLFISVDGTKLVCDDGSSFDTATWEWV